jgi:hypothetical protein
MSRNLIRILTAVVALNCIVVGSIMVWPDTASSTANKTFTAKPDFDHAFASATTPPRSEYVPAFLTMIDFERVLAGVTPMTHRDAPAILTTVHFDRVFASVSTPLRGNTPPTREKLRNAGWKRILGSS